MNKPYQIDFQIAGGINEGSLSFVESGNLPFDIERVYWIYDVDKGDKRGGHAHTSSDRLLVCTAGSAEVTLQNANGEKYLFTLTHPAQGLIFPANHWIDIEFLEKSVLMVLVSSSYENDEYLSDYDQFLSK